MLYAQVRKDAALTDVSETQRERCF